MGKMKKKYESGAATAFIPRNQAIKKLQLTIADFRRLCILKGVYPVEPKNKKVANKGKTSAANRTFYYAKDIAYLSHEPLIAKFRDFKIYVKRLKRARGRRDVKALGRLRAHKPTYNLDHIVKERYPTYIDAVRDLDDCLSLIYLFSCLPKSKRVYVEKVHFCRRLALEFMHFVIASKALRKCFISIKGYYFQAEIRGQKVTWIMPHKLTYQVPDDVDFRIMSTFVDFYSIMLGFVNYKSYTDEGLIYPPQLSILDKKIDSQEEKDDDYNDEYLASLNCDVLKKTDDTTDDNNLTDEFQLNDNPNLVEKTKLEEENLKKLQTLFKGLKFFLNREIPREQFAFAIRSFSGQVSWDKSTAVGSTYQEDDETITHQIVDRPIVKKPHLNRVYVQPQWIFDSINENELLPVADYLPGAVLPAHLSPFIDDMAKGYVPEKKATLVEDSTSTEEKKKTEETVVIGSRRIKENTNKADEKDDHDDEDKHIDMKVDLDSPDEEEEEEESESDKEDDENNGVKKNDKPTIAVRRAKPQVENKNVLLSKQLSEEKRLTELMIPKKDKHLYDKIVHSKKMKRREIEKLKEKRSKIEKKNVATKNGHLKTGLKNN